MVNQSGDIGKVGEQLVTHQLEHWGFAAYRNTRQAGATDISATKDADRRLVQVKTSIHPSAPGQLSSAERALILLRAAAESATAWQARVVLTERLELQSPIEWVQVLAV